MHRIRPLLIILIFLIFVNLKLLRWKTDCHTSLLRNELGLGVLAGVCRHLSLTLVTQLLLEILAQLFFSWSTRSLRLPLLRVNLMDWFYDLVIIDRPWEDSKSKYGSGTDTRVTFTDSFFIRWVEQIHDTSINWFPRIMTLPNTLGASRYMLTLLGRMLILYASQLICPKRVIGCWLLLPLKVGVYMFLTNCVIWDRGTGLRWTLSQRSSWRLFPYFSSALISTKKGTTLIGTMPLNTLTVLRVTPWIILLATTLHNNEKIQSK